MIGTHVAKIPAPAPFFKEIDFVSAETGERLDTYVPRRFAIKFVPSVATISGFGGEDVRLRHYNFKTGQVTVVPATDATMQTSTTPVFSKRLEYERTWSPLSPGLLVLDVNPNQFQYSSTETRGNDMVLATHYVGSLPF
eukprot:jgi/Mesvir1/16611/Mv10145-RA.1